MLEKLLKTLKNTRPDADWAIFGSAARARFEQVELGRPPTTDYTDIDIVTNAMVTREGFVNLMRGCFEVLDIQFGDEDTPPAYAIQEIRKRVIVITENYGILDFVFIPGDKKVFQNWHTDKYQAGPFSQCTYHWDFLTGKGMFFKTTPAFRSAIGGGSFITSPDCKGTPQYWKKQHALLEKVRKNHLLNS